MRIIIEEDESAIESDQRTIDYVAANFTDLVLGGNVIVEPIVAPSPPPPIVSLILVLDDEECDDDDAARHWECSSCGSDEFQYDESHPSSRSMDENDESGLTFDGNFEWFDGDDSPGVVCASCDSTLDVPAECEINFS